MMRRRLVAAAVGALMCVLAGCSMIPDDGTPAEPSVGDTADTDQRGGTEPTSEEPTEATSEEPAETTEPAEDESTGGSGWNIDTTVPVNEDSLLGANPLFLDPGASIAAVGCELPAWSLDPAAAEVYYQAAIECHHEAWVDTFAAIGIDLQMPSLWAGAVSTDYNGACGSNDTGREAFYCSSDRTIVMPFDTMNSIAQYGEGYALAVLSHEYGHHLQEQAGVFAAFTARANQAGWESEDGQLLNRMLELQAWCFSGMFYGTNAGSGSITVALWDQAYDNNSQAGDRPGELRYHGTNESIASWFGWGGAPGDDAASSTPSAYECNPWAARSDDWLQ